MFNLYILSIVDYLPVIIIVSVIIVIIIAISILMKNIHQKQMNKMFAEVEAALNSLKKNEEEFKLVRCYTYTHDYYFETPNYNYYIKVVPNISNAEICVNNAVKWQLRKSINDDAMRFVEGIEPLMRMEFEPSSKPNKKLYIVYPNARSLLKYINECEMVFVKSNTDVYGTNIITYVDLLSNPDVINL